MTKEEMIKNIKKEVKPKKMFGQNFLINPRVYEKIIGAAEIQEGEEVLEIGAGTGILTRYLTDAGARVTAVEKDKGLIHKIKEAAPEAKVIEGDILKIKPDLKVYKVIGNIPYYLTSRLIKNIFEEWPRPKLIILMVQHEVAKRIAAKVPNMSMLSLSVQYYADIQTVSKVGRGNFWPMPDVDSAILKLIPKNVPKNNQLFSLARKAFAGKRKKLGNTLRDCRDALEKIGIDPDRRPETLTLEEWLRLAASI